MNDVRIVRLLRGVDLWRWLCRKCAAAEKAKGWDITGKKVPPHELACDGDGCREGTK